MTLVMQKDDTFDIEIESSVLTHPTTGPLYGSFKLENHLFFIPFRLYNSWLHNNRLGIGLDMSQIKLPQLYVKLNKLNDQPGEDEQQWSQVNPSCLLSYLGIKGYGGMKTSATEEKFKSTKAAQMQINKTNWDLVSALVYALKEADKWAENNQDIINQTRTKKDE